MINKSDKKFLPAKRATLVDAVDRVVEKGAAIEGNVALSVAEVNLVVLGLRLVIASAPDNQKDKTTTEKDREYIREVQKKIRKIESQIPKIIATNDPKTAEKGIAKIVLTLIVLIKELMEREVIRKMDRKALSKTKIEKLGLTFQAIDKKIEELKKVFGIEEDLNIDLGPLGKLL